MVVVELQDFNLGVHAGVQSLAQEFASKGRDVVVKKFKEFDILANFEVLADSAYALVFTESLPQTDGGAVLVSKRL